MKVFKNKVFIGSVSFCKELKQSAKKDPTIFSSRVEDDIIFIKTNEGTFIKLEELMKCYMPYTLARKHAKQYKLQPEKKGDYFIKNLKPYFKNNTCDETEKVDLRDLLTASKTL